MAELITLARPYAKAAFERAKAQQALAEWAEVLNAAGQVAADEATRQLLTDPGLAEQKKADVILDCTGKSVSEEQRNFLTILADNRRLALLPEIATLFNSFRADLERTIDINVSYTTPVCCMARKDIS